MPRTICADLFCSSLFPLIPVIQLSAENQDVQILSVIGTKYSKIVRPSLTSCDIDMYEVGSIGMRMLTKLLNGSLKNKVYPFVSTIEKRESTRV